jgi:hypothetical protein
MKWVRENEGMRSNDRTTTISLVLIMMQRQKPLLSSRYVHLLDIADGRFKVMEKIGPTMLTARMVSSSEVMGDNVDKQDLTTI